MTTPTASAAAASILVVGAGPTGLTMAAALVRYGICPRIIDRALEPPADRSRAIVLQARTLELFENLGIIRQVLDAALVVEAANVFSPRGRRGSLRIRPEWIDSAYAQLTTLPQDETERILGDLIARNAVQVERGVELVALEQTALHVIATLRHANGRIERVAADWIIGCDGAHSAVRHLSGLIFPGDTYKDECLLGDVEMDWALPDGQLSVCPVADGVLLAFPLPGPRHFRIIMILPAAAAPEARHLAESEFAAQLRRMVPRLDDSPREPVVRSARWLTRYRLHRRGVTSYRIGRCFVAGDAAHIHSPVGGQGMNTGIQDAYNLAWKLALVLRGETEPAILDTYHDERHRVGEFLLRSTDRMFAVVTGGGAFGRLVRRLMPTLAVRLLGAPIVGKRLARFISQTAIRYRHSALSTESPGARRLPSRAPRAGDRAPDVRLADECRLFDLLREPAHTLLLFSGASAAMGAEYAQLAEQIGARYGTLVRTVVIRRPGGATDDAVIDVSGAAHFRYGAEEGAIYLVRPDGHIGFRGAGSDADDLRATLAARLLPKRVTS